jgi:ankyrin repeat protein
MKDIKIMKKILLMLTLGLSMIEAHGMEQTEVENYLSKVPLDIQKLIIRNVFESGNFEEALKALEALPLVNKRFAQALQELLQNPQFVKFLIQRLVSQAKPKTPFKAIEIAEKIVQSNNPLAAILRHDEAAMEILVNQLIASLPAKSVEDEKGIEARIKIARGVGTDSAIQWLKKYSSGNQEIQKYLRELIHSALATGDIKALKFLAKVVGLDEPITTAGHTLLTRAVAENDINAVKNLIEAGASLNAPGLQGNTPLIVSIVKEQHPLLHILLEAKADPNVPNKESETPLMIAATQGDLEALRALIEAGAHINVQDTSGFTALMMAANHNQKNAVEALLKAGADATLKDKAGRTALAYATVQGNKAIITLLQAVAKPKV